MDRREAGDSDEIDIGNEERDITDPGLRVQQFCVARLRGKESLRFRKAVAAKDQDQRLLPAASLRNWWLAGTLAACFG